MIGLGLTQLIPITFYILGISLFIIAIFYRVDIPIAILSCLLPFTNILIKIQQFPLGNKYVDLLLIAIIIGWVREKKVKNERVLINTPLNKVIFFYIIFLYLELWVGSFTLGLPLPILPSELRLQTYKNFIILPILFFVVTNNLNDKKKIKFLILFLSFAILALGYSFFKDYRWISKDVFYESKRWSGTFVYLGPNEWAAFHAHYLFVLLGIFLFGKLKIPWKIILFLAIILSIYSVIFSYSRGAYLGVLFGLVFICFIKKKVLIIPLLIFMIFWQSFLPNAVKQRINETRSEDASFDDSSLKRLELWNQAFYIFKRNPLIGNGFNTAPYLNLSGKGEEFGDTHNIYVKILMEQGIIGLLIFLILLIKGFIRGWRLYALSNDYFMKGLGLGFVTCSIVLMVTNFFGDRWTYIQVGLYYWIFLGLVESGNRLVLE